MLSLVKCTSQKVLLYFVPSMGKGAGVKRLVLFENLQPLNHAGIKKTEGSGMERFRRVQI